MSDKGKLKNVTSDNSEAVVELELDAGQEDLVASNFYSVAEVQFDPDARPHVVYAGKLPDVRRAEKEGQGAGKRSIAS